MPTESPRGRGTATVHTAVPDPARDGWRLGEEKMLRVKERKECHRRRRCRFWLAAPALTSVGRSGAGEANCGWRRWSRREKRWRGDVGKSSDGRRRLCWGEWCAAPWVRGRGKIPTKEEDRSGRRSWFLKGLLPTPGTLFPVLLKVLLIGKWFLTKVDKLFLNRIKIYYFLFFNQNKVIK